MFRLVLACVIGGGVLAYMGYQEWTLASGTEAEPEAITCAKLVERGAEGNAHVEMGDFLLCNFAYVYKGKSETDFDSVWIPAVPIDGEYSQQLAALFESGNLDARMPIPRNIQVIVKSKKVDNDDEVTALADQETIRGLVVNEIDSLDADEKKLLKESYPSVNFDTVLILEHGRQPAGAGKVFAFIGGGLALIVLGGFIGLGSMGADA